MDNYSRKKNLLAKALPNVHNLHLINEVSIIRCVDIDATASDISELFPQQHLDGKTLPNMSLKVKFFQFQVPIYTTQSFKATEILT